MDRLITAYPTMKILKSLEPESFQFNEDDQVIISKTKLMELLMEASKVSFYLESDLQDESCFILMDNNRKDLYPISQNQIRKWEKDGSCECGDKLFRLQLIKKY